MPFFSTYGVSFRPLEVGYRATKVSVSGWIEYFGGQCLCWALFNLGKVNQWCTQCTQLVSQLCTPAANTTRHTNFHTVHTAGVPTLHNCSQHNQAYEFSHSDTARVPTLRDCSQHNQAYQLSHSAHSSCPNFTRLQPTQPGIPTFTQCTQLVSQLCTTAANTTKTFTQCIQLVSQLCTTAANTTRHTPLAVVYIVCSPDDEHNDARNMLS